MPHLPSVNCSDPTLEYTIREYCKLSPSPSSEEIKNVTDAVYAYLSNKSHPITSTDVHDAGMLVAKGSYNAKTLNKPVSSRFSNY